MLCCCVCTEILFFTHILMHIKENKHMPKMFKPFQGEVWILYSRLWMVQLGLMGWMQWNLQRRCSEQIQVWHFVSSCDQDSETFLIFIFDAFIHVYTVEPV